MGLPGRHSQKSLSASHCPPRAGQVQSPPWRGCQGIFRRCHLHWRCRDCAQLPGSSLSSLLCFTSVPTKCLNTTDVPVTLAFLFSVPLHLNNLCALSWSKHRALKSDKILPSHEHTQWGCLVILTPHHSSDTALACCTSHHVPAHAGEMGYRLSGKLQTSSFTATSRELQDSSCPQNYPIIALAPRNW